MQTAAVRPATDRQLAYITKLAAERGSDMEALAASSKLAALSTAQASQLIDALLKLPKTVRVNVRTTETGAPTVTRDETVTEPGMYRTPSLEIARVVRSAAGGLYAKKLTKIGGDRLTEDGETVKWDFTYVPGLIRTLRASDRMTLEQAKAFGVQHGICCVCGAYLTDAKSVAAGIGPVCATRV